MQGMLMAITRAVSPSMDACELSYIDREIIDISQARAQHAAYEAALRELGVNVISLPAEPDFPDAVFVEDPAIVLDEIAIMTRTGAESRRGESESIATTLEPYRELRWMHAPATLDGGDVMRAGRTLYVGRSARTSAAGIEQLAHHVEPFGYRVCTVEVHACLHLKSACSYLGEGMVLVYRPWINTAAFEDLRLIDAPDPEAVNVVRIENTVLVAEGFPRTAAIIEDLELQVRTLDNSELRKAEGALTCCSLLFETY
ncbi:MAG: Dimethylargininase [Candidatus Solibacter sp.]|nr:Dimethylargininase [Candidatus Solibacter sp.]